MVTIRVVNQVRNFTPIIAQQNIKSASSKRERFLFERVFPGQIVRSSSSESFKANDGRNFAAVSTRLKKV